MKLNLRNTGSLSTATIATLENLPPEIKMQICSSLPQDSLHALVPISPAFSEAAIVYLYRSPTFRSTYRFAQFVTTISHSRNYADMVRKFDLPKYLEDDCDTGRTARWIEWKFRAVDLYAAKHSPHKTPQLDTHPARNPFLGRGYGTVPIGAIVHVLAACRNLRLRLLFQNVTCSVCLPSEGKLF